MLLPGSLIFVGFDADNEDVAFVTTAEIAGGEVIYFTDSEWNGSAFLPGEQLIEWTVPTEGIPPGSILTLDMAVGLKDAAVTDTGSLSGEAMGSVDYITGGGNLASSNEMFWAFQGDRVGDEVTATNFIGVIGNEADGGSRKTPNLDNTGLNDSNGAIIIDGDHDYMAFDGFDGLSGPLTAEDVIEAVSDLSNWTVVGPGNNGENDNPLPANGFDNISPVTVSAPPPVTTLFFSGDHVAYFDDISSSDSDVSTEIGVSEQPFLPSDIVEIDILNSSIRPDGEFDFDEVIFTRMAVTRDGVSYEFDVDDGSKVKESGAKDDESGQAIEQGDTFFTTNDEVGAPSDGPFSGLDDGKLAFALNAIFVEGETTTIVREQSLTDSDGDPVGVENANFFVGLSLNPPPCFVAGTHILTKTGPVAVENLNAGDLIATKDHGFQPIRWIGARRCLAVGDFAPVHFRAGSVGNTADLLVSPQHRILVSGWQSQLVCGQDEMLVPARFLCNRDTVFRARHGGEVAYFHILLERHEVIFAEGAPTESLDLAYVTTLPDHHPMRREIAALFPELLSGEEPAVLTNRPVAKAHEGKLLSAVG